MLAEDTLSPRKKSKERPSKERDRKDDIASPSRKGPRFPSLTPTKSRKERASVAVSPIRDDSPVEEREEHTRQSSDFLPLSRLAKDSRHSTSMLALTSRKEVRSEGVAELRKVKSNASLSDKGAPSELDAMSLDKS